MQSLTQCNLDIFVPHIVNEKIHHWPHNGVKNCGYFISIQRHSRKRLQLHECWWSKEKRNQNYVRAAGTEGFEPTRCRTDAEGVGEDQGIINGVGETGHYDIDTHHNENHQLIDVGACAGELEERRNVTRVMIDDVTVTEGESQHTPSVGHGTHKPHRVCTHHLREADLMGHGDLVKQGLTESHIWIIGHWCQNTALFNNKEGEETKLNHALCLRDDVLVYKTHQYFRGDDRGAAEINEGKVEEKVVHGSVQVRVQTNQNNQANVPHHGDQIYS